MIENMSREAGENKTSFYGRLPKSLTTVTTFSKLVTLSLFILLPFAGFFVGIRYQEKMGGMIFENSKTACTMDAKLCPDGSSVGRSGPSCEFSPCPSPETSQGKPTIPYLSPTPYNKSTHSPTAVNNSCSIDSDCTIINIKGDFSNPCIITSCFNYNSPDAVGVNEMWIKEQFTGYCPNMFACTEPIVASQRSYTPRCINSVCQKVKN